MIIFQSGKRTNQEKRPGGPVKNSVQLKKEILKDFVKEHLVAFYMQINFFQYFGREITTNQYKFRLIIELNEYDSCIIRACFYTHENFNFSKLFPLLKDKLKQLEKYRSLSMLSQIEKRGRGGIDKSRDGKMRIDCQERPINL